MPERARLAPVAGALSAGKTGDLSETNILDIHNTILRGINDGNAGHYRSVPVRMSGSTVVLPNPRSGRSRLRGAVASRDGFVGATVPGARRGNGECVGLDSALGAIAATCCRDRRCDGPRRTAR